MTLAEEAQRYLAVVEAFRAEGREPHWHPETARERARLSGSSVPLSPKTPTRRK
jgi:hypothetical protein